MIGVRFSDHLQNGFLCCMIGFRYQIIDALFVVNGERLLKKSQDLFSAGPDGIV
jgi:hypothetical protein